MNHLRISPILSQTVRGRRSGLFLRLSLKTPILRVRSAGEFRDGIAGLVRALYSASRLHLAHSLPSFPPFPFLLSPDQSSAPAACRISHGARPWIFTLSHGIVMHSARPLPPAACPCSLLPSTSATARRITNGN